MPTEDHRSATPLELLFDLVFVVAVASLVAATGPRDRRGPRRSSRAVPDGVLRDLVGVDELHLVRLGLRHRRRALPRPHRRADGRGAGAGGRRARRRSRAIRLRGRHGRLPDHARRAGRAVGPGGDRAPRDAGRRRAGTRSASPSCRCGWVARLLLPVEVVLASRSSCSRSPSSPCRCGPSGRAGRRGIRGTSPSATGCSRSSCSARECSRRPTRVQDALADGLTAGARRGRGRRAGAARRAVVDVLPRAGGRGAAAAARVVVLLGLRALLPVRRARCGRRGARGRASRRSRITSRSPDMVVGYVARGARSPWCSSCSGCCTCRSR